MYISVFFCVFCLLGINLVFLPYPWLASVETFQNHTSTMYPEIKKITIHTTPCLHNLQVLFCVYHALLNWIVLNVSPCSLQGANKWLASLQGFLFNPIFASISHSHEISAISKPDQCQNKTFVDGKNYKKTWIE